ncbi:MAG: OmpH family outer membrane protein [Candidatus Omnitrophica bacterium]|nr:OmpH family outer membrane protein [Candidatus Omnitrophota bacterium]MBU3934126.1 OmpH family outer membrane protein [Candidatus Omnitrophota bacterium]
MRKVLVVLIMVLFCSWVIPGYAEGLNLGFVNLKKVLDEYEKVKEGEGQLLKEAEEKNSQREKLVKEIKNSREKLDLLKDKQKEKKQQELDEKIKELQDFTYETRAVLRQKRDEKFREIMKEVKDVLEEYGQSRNYNIIIDDTLLLYKDSSLDVTEDVIKILNQRYKK